MQSSWESAPVVRFLAAAAGVVLLVAGLRAAATIIVPFLVSVFLAILAGPAVFFLKRFRIPSWVAVLLVVLTMMALLGSIGVFLSSSLNRFLLELPEYDIRFDQEVSVLHDWLMKRGIRVSQAHLEELVNASSVIELGTEVLASVGTLITGFLLVTISLIFILLEASSFPRKVRKVFRNADTTLLAFQEFTGKLNRYVVIKTFTSLLTAVGVGLFNVVCEVEFPLLWAIVAFLLNYIPNLGSIIAAVPPIVLTFLKYGLGAALVVALGYLIINVVISNVVEPRLMGKGLGLSTLVVFSSLVVWAWILGPAGMLLAIPLTVTIKIALESNQKTRAFALLLGPPGDASLADFPIPPQLDSPSESPSDKDEPGIR